MGSIVGKITDAVGLTDIKGTQDRANQAAAEQRAAALQGAQVSSFRPVGMTTRFGTSNFGITDVGGVPRVTSADYQVSPELRALQDQLFGLTGGAMTTAQGAQQAAAPLGAAAQGLFNLGGQYIATTPEQARQQYLDEQYAMIDPVRQREENRLASTVFGRGRAGLNIGDTGQPELFALASARRAQDLQLAAQAENAAQQRTTYGAGLFNQGAGLLGSQYGIPTQSLAGLQSYLGSIGAIEELGQDPFRLGLSVGGASQPGATAGAGLLSSGLSSAALSQQRGGDAASAQLTNFMGGMLKSAIGGFGGAGGGFGGIQSAFSQTGLGSSGFGTGLAYGNRDYGTYF